MITLIAAVSENLAIGKNNALLWHLPNDLKFFKTKTQHQTIILGRKTFESFGAKPLPNRIHIIVSRTYTTSTQKDVFVVDSIEKAMEKAKEFQREIYIIGGGEIYTQAVDFADTLLITFVKTTIEADVFFPEITKKDWKLVETDFHSKDEKHAYDYEFRTYIRKK